MKKLIQILSLSLLSATLFTACNDTKCGNTNCEGDNICIKHGTANQCAKKCADKTACDQAKKEECKPAKDLNDKDVKVCTPPHTTGGNDNCQDGKEKLKLQGDTEAKCYKKCTAATDDTNCPSTVGTCTLVDGKTDAWGCKANP